MYKMEQISWKKKLKLIPRKLDEISAVLYTSGSTGDPKGAIFTQELTLPSEGLATIFPFVRIDFQKFDPSFLLSILQSLISGGKRLFSRDLVELMKDMKIGRPTHIGATPLFWTSLYRDFCNRLSTRIQLEKRQDVIQLEKRKIGDEMRSELGNRLVVATSGGAPIRPQVLDFIKEILKIDIVDLYGSRETGGISKDGIIYPGIDVILLPLDHVASDQDREIGEICVRSPRMIPGYWNDPKNNETKFIEIQGKKYYRTGDIGELIDDGELKRIRVVDRCGEMIKLSHGGWISPTRIESILENCPSITSAFVMGTSSEDFVVAVIVPSPIFLKKYPLLSDDSSVREKMTTDMQDDVRFWGIHHHLNFNEIPRKIFIKISDWKSDSNLMTLTEKKRRGNFNRHFQDVKCQMYEEIRSGKIGNECGNGGNGSGKVSDELVDMLREVTGISPGSADELSNVTFGEIGGDSISASRLCKIISEKFGKDLSIKNIYEYSLSHLSDIIFRSRDAYFQVEKEFNFYDDYHLPKDIVAGSGKKGSHVMLTGAVGFLGPFLLDFILKKYSEDVLVYCLVRENSSMSASDRVIADLKRSHLWNEDAFEKRIRVVPGDLSKPLFGWTRPEFDAMAKEISIIYHSGSRVNLTIPYVGLRSTNVLGTIEVIRLASLHRADVVYISSIAALPSHDLKEDWMFLNRREMQMKDGYGQTKVVSERLIHDAKIKCGLNVKIFRVGTICGDGDHRTYNRLDFGSILLRSCKHVGGAVMSTKNLLHWIPVDFVAESVVAISTSSTNEEVFHLSGEGPSLIDVLSSMKAQGIQLDDISASEWKSRIEKAITETNLAFPLKDTLKNFNWMQSGGLPIPTGKTKEILQKKDISWRKCELKTTILFE
eukprot:TRINITY_DN8159_c0_g1_i1.p1 TRINITY_DN8159_c0_g1~~TRINITY_DN8159_c0_g1_i1.p1  ORF type:complete len:883 (-),score=283.55 TRINITY_DN8159_c0_g1_i1:13-2661(-)